MGCRTGGAMAISRCARSLTTPSKRLRRLHGEVVTIPQDLVAHDVASGTDGLHQGVFAGGASSRINEPLPDGGEGG